MSPGRYANLRSLLIYGGGGHGLVVADAAVASGWQVLGFLDDSKPGKTVGSFPVLSHDAASAPGVGVIIAVGDNHARQRLFQQGFERGWAMVSIIHPTAWVSPSATIGYGVYIGPQAVVNAQARIEDGVIINSGAIVEHHCIIGKFTHLAPRVVLAGEVQVGMFSLVGTGAAVRPRVQIGNDCTLGAGTVLVKDVPDHQIVVGVPGKPLR